MVLVIFMIFQSRWFGVKTASANTYALTTADYYLLKIHSCTMTGSACVRSRGYLYSGLCVRYIHEPPIDTNVEILCSEIAYTICRLASMIAPSKLSTS